MARKAKETVVLTIRKGKKTTQVFGESIEEVVAKAKGEKIETNTNETEKGGE